MNNSKSPLLGTHSGVFHADDILAAAILRRIYPKCEIVRTRDQSVLDSCDIVFDVGGIYDAETRRYDHHMPERAGERPNGILYSSAGLVWKHHAHELCPSDIAKIVDEKLMQPIDATDNGQSLFEGGTPKFKGCHGYSFSRMLSALNPFWDEHQDFDAAFLEAVEIAGLILDREMVFAQGSLKAQKLTQTALNSRLERPLLVLNQFHPWQEAAVEDSDVIFCAFPSETGDWRLQCVPPELGSFEKRLALPEAWAGLRGGDLAALTNVSDAVFCHPGRFICGARSKEGVLELARQALL